MNFSMRLVVRLWTATGMSWWATLRARFAPIVARPVRPKCGFEVMVWNLVIACESEPSPG